jgi:hypothetical protein
VHDESVGDDFDAALDGEERGEPRLGGLDDLIGERPRGEGLPI